MPLPVVCVGRGQAQSPTASTEPPFYRCYHKFQALREASESASWETIFMQSWASSTLDIYERHLKIQGNALTIIVQIADTHAQGIPLGPVPN